MRDRLSQLIKMVQAGQDIVITSHGRPVARLVPVRGHTGAEILKWLDDNRLPLASRRTQAEIDEYVAQQRASCD